MLKANGNKGKLLAGGRNAALLGSWTLESVPHTGDCLITAAVIERDKYWSEAVETFTLVLLLGDRQWRWVNAAAAFTGSTVTITTKGRPTE